MGDNMRFMNILWFLPQILAMIHFFRNRPEGYWFWIILFFGPLGAIIYLFAVVMSDAKGAAIQGKVRSGMADRRRMRVLLAKAGAGEALPYEFFELGEIQYKLRKYDLAANSLVESIKRAPENKDARFYLGLSLEKLGRFKEAGQQLEAIVVRDPQFKFNEAMLALARCYKGAGESQAAIAAYKRVLSQNNYTQARYELAELLIGAGEKEQAKTQLNQLIRDVETADVPAFKRRDDKKWVRKAKSLLSSLS